MLLDAAKRRRPSPGESLHGVAATFLDELGLDRGFLEQTARRSYLAEIAWESAELRERRAIDHAWGPDCHVDRDAFDAWLTGEAERGGAERMGCVAFERAVFDHALARFRCSVRCESASITISCGALVDGTGRSAVVMRQLTGRAATGSDTLIAASRSYSEPLARPSVLIEATDDGWWYSAPQPGNRSVAIWFTDAAVARGRAAQPEGFDAALHASVHTRARVAGLKSDSAPSVCAAGPSRSMFDVGLPALPVGDAAAAFDPISGDGLCFALRSALEAAETLVRLRAGDRHALAAYAAGVEAVYVRHVTRRAQLYDAVVRFGDAPFWKRRQHD